MYSQHVVNQVYANHFLIVHAGMHKCNTKSYDTEKLRKMRKRKC